MSANTYWSVESCRWETYAPVADALATPWSVVAAAQEPVDVPEQRQAQGAPVQA